MTDTAELIAKLRAKNMHLNDLGRTALIEDPDCIEAADALSSLVRERDEAKSIAASAQANVFRLVAAGRDDLELMKETAATVQSLIARATAAEADAARMREALEPSAATKAAYIGEFTIAVERIVNEDEEPIDDGADAPDPYDHIQVPWATIKQIMAAIRARALSNTSEGGKDVV